MIRSIRRLAQPDYLVLTVMAAVQAGIIWHFASRSFFWGQDFTDFQTAMREGLSFRFLTKEVVIHLAPAHRLGSYLIQRYATLNFDVALGVLLLFQVATMVLMQRILALLFGRLWWTFALAFAFGTSVIFMASLQWWAGGLHTIPATALSLATVYAYLRWRASGWRGWVVVSALTFCLGLLFYSKTLLVPGYILLMRVLLLERFPSMRSAARAIADERWVWVAYLLPSAAYLVAYAAGGYGESPHYALHTLGDFLRLAWLKGFAPTVIGVRIPKHPEIGHEISIVAAQLAILGAVIFSLRRSPRAWRAWFFFAVTALINLLLVSPRLADFGPGIAYDHRYITELAFLFALALAFALAPASGPAGIRPFPPSGQASLVPPSARAALAAGLALVAYLTLVWTSDGASVREFPGPRARSYIGNLRSDLRRLEAAGVRPVLLDDLTPRYVSPELRRNSFSQIIPLFDTNVRYDVPSTHTYRVGRDGHLREVRFMRAAGGGLENLLAAGTATVRRGSQTGSRGSQICIRAGAMRALLNYRPARTLRGPPWYLRVAFRQPASKALPVYVDRGVQFPHRPDVVLPTADRAGISLVALGALPGAIPSVERVALIFPPGIRGCITTVEIGSFQHTAPR